LEEDTSLNEAELKYSESLFKAFYQTTLNHYKKGVRQAGSKVVKLSGDEIFEILYSDNKKIINGYAILFLVHFEGSGRQIGTDDFAFIKNNWHPQNGIKESLLGKLLERGISLKFFVVADGGLGSAGASKKRISMYINPWAHEDKTDGRLNKELLQSTIRHELQHLTQVINGLSLKYGEQLFASNGDASKMKKLDLNFEKEFGVGKQKTGLRQISSKKAREQGISEKERIKRYLGDDFEYETWMSDILDDLIRWLFKNEYIKKRDLSFAAYKAANPDILSEQKIDTEARKRIINLAKEMEMKPIDVVKFYKKAPSFNQIAVKYVKAILPTPDRNKKNKKDIGGFAWINDAILNMFATDSKVSNYPKAVKTLLLLRPKEFAGDLVKNLELRLQALTENTPK